MFRFNLFQTYFLIATWTSLMNPIVLSNKTLINLLNNGGYAIISAEHNPNLSNNEFGLTDEAIQERLGNLSTDLTNKYLYSNVLGVYDGASEYSFLVILHNDLPDRERALIYRLGEKYNQDSVIYVKQALPVVQQLIYTTGPLNGTYVEGQGYKILTTDVTDNYSSVQLCSNVTLTFTLNFDFEQMITNNNTKTKTQQLIKHHAQNRMRNQLRKSIRLVH
ncbi:unnamed protein product [Adineta steineri]|uniref:Uncharacterized protein n=1 Tax=Adineta steineri TaxID=433720 RepID=A0A815S8I6_9BILA|nr:unnamed protein product [Adineta steineri]CAF1484835.1 unnamed protein product [Adineta steineri]